MCIAYGKTEKLAVGRADRGVEISVLQIYGCHPNVDRQEGENKLEGGHFELYVLDK